MLHVAHFRPASKNLKYILEQKANQNIVIYSSKKGYFYVPIFILNVHFKVN